MPINSGKALLNECMGICKCTNQMENIIYKSGNRQSAAAYQHDTITTSLLPKELKANARYVIKYFYHMNIFAAWDIEAGRGSNKYLCYKRNLEEIENGQLPVFSEVCVENYQMYLFRGRDGVMEFVRTVLA